MWRKNIQKVNENVSCSLFAALNRNLTEDTFCDLEFIFAYSEEEEEDEKNDMHEGGGSRYNN